MRPRLVVGGGPSNGFPRWGYLDKFAVNEYMARAFAVTVALSIAVAWGLNVWRTLSPDVSPGDARVIHLTTGQVDLSPPPAIFPSLPRVGGAHVVRSPHPIVPRPVPIADPNLDIDVGSNVGNASTPITAEGSDGDAESSIVPETSGGAGPWPSPDDLVVVEQEPVLVAMQTPVYPEIARDAGLEGTVLVRALVDVDGAVRDVRLLQGVRGFDEAALAAAATAVFRPARQQDKPVAVWVVIPIEFRLRD